MKINKKSSIMFSIALVSASFVVGTGCSQVVSATVGAAAGAGTVAYIGGKVCDTLDANLDVTYQAVTEAFKELKFAVGICTKDTLQAQLEAQNSNDDSIKVTLTKVSDTVTKIAIRVGFFGDEQQSMQILDEVKTQIPGYYKRKTKGF